MLIVSDVKSLEVACVAYLSQDEQLCREVIDQTDFHDLNQKRFSLPDRTTAKIFMFKLIYGATAWGYANDGDFVAVSTREKFWQGVIDEFYAKYIGIRKWHVKIVQDAISSGKFDSPSGRQFIYPSQDVIARNWFWRPKILNFPVQSLGADLVMLFRISLWNRLRGMDNVKLVSSVHDNLVVDTTEKMCYTIVKEMNQAIENVPENFKRQFGIEFNLPLKVEVKVGNDLKNMEKIKEC